MLVARAERALPGLEPSRFVTFDGGFAGTNLLQRPDRYRHLEADLGNARRIARGGGMSYAAASFGSDSIVQQMSAFNRLLAFDRERRTLRVEAGAEIGALAAWAEGHGLMLPVLPGYPTITVGGCIAADVHGKNPLRDGTFRDWVAAMTLYHPRHGFCSLDPARDPELFEATCGGYGLTGLIVDATLRLVEQHGASYAVEATPVASFQHAAEEIALRSRSHEFAYSWHDGTLRGSAFGRGIVFAASWTGEPGVREGRAGEQRSYRPMTAESRGKWPVGLWNRATGRAANAYFRRRALASAIAIKTTSDASFPFARQSLYHRMFGRRGFAEVQLLVPDRSWSFFVERLAAAVQQGDPPLMMMSIKRLRGGSRSLGLSGEGNLIALDLARGATTSRFLAAVDELAVDAGAQPNLAKDSRLPQGVAAAALPHYQSFRECLRRWDGDRLYESELSRRLKL